MYQVQIPVINLNVNCEEALKEIRRAGAGRVWLAPARGIEPEEVLSAELETLRRNMAFFEKNGLEVGVWISSLGHGGTLVQDDPGALVRAGRYEKMVGLEGTTCEDSFCPTDEAFVEDYVGWIGRLAETGAKMIMLDDDYRLSLRRCGNGCCCDRHMKEYCERVGETVTRDQLKELVFSGGPSKYRTAWLEMCHDSLIGLAKKIRARVDEVNPETRVGVCAVMTTWDVDGVNAMELTRALAGNTKPFLRTIGAPYWSANEPKTRRLGYVISMNRMQRYWCEHSGVELFSEGDVYPRPRYMTPASYLEMYDMALRADGGWDGILKYMIDYSSSEQYEHGYVDRMVRNRPVYDWIETHMAKGTADGADIICGFDRLKHADLPEGMTYQEANEAFFCTPAVKLAADCCVPVTFGTGNVHIAFGENGRYITEDQLSDGAVIDIGAAKILMDRGVDVGIEKMGAAQTISGLERFPGQNERVAVGNIRRFRDVELREGAEALSFIGGHVTACRYENEKGQRFLVYPFDMDASWMEMGVCRSYCRQKQLIEGLEWAGRKKLPAVLTGHPDIHVICKRTEEGLAVGVWNLSADYLADAEIRTDAAYNGMETFGYEGEVRDGIVKLRGELAPYAFAGILLTKNT
ncbi:MAG: hypothetical protein IJE08_08465 [Clostridia bacterium]|nr:hypothetical protein [Clostridia bacterium]